MNVSRLKLSLTTPENIKLFKDLYYWGYSNFTEEELIKVLKYTSSSEGKAEFSMVAKGYRDYTASIMKEIISDFLEEIKK